MKVLQIDVDGWVYGRPVYVLKLAQLLLEEGIECKIIGASGLFEEEVWANNIKNIRTFYKWKPLDRSFRSMVNLYRIIKNEKPDVVHSHGITENMVLGVIGFLLGIPIVATYHTNPFKKYEKEKSTKKKIKRFVYELAYIRCLTKLAARNFAYITVISRELKESFIKQGYREDKILVTYFGLDMAKGDIKPDSRRSDEMIMVFVGRISAEKGCDILLKSCDILAKRGKHFKLYLIGDGSIEYFSNMANKLGVDNRVFFCGYQRVFDDIFSRSDVFILPSIGEGLPISILEAMAYGLPVIATNVGGIPEVIEDGENGFLVPPGDEVSLANAIGKMMEKGSDGRYVMGLKSKEKIEKSFSSRKMVNSYLDIYGKAISHAEAVK
jgi:glycosyltransferase involved in cell wall biosynthesis